MKRAVSLVRKDLQLASQHKSFSRYWVKIRPALCEEVLNALAEFEALKTQIEFEYQYKQNLINGTCLTATNERLPQA